MAPTYQYQPLNVDKKEIRIIEILPSKKNDRLISLSIKHVSLLESPTYWTLSYTWGAPFEGLSPDWDDPKAVHVINVDGCEFEIRWNLEAALRALQDTGDVSTIWVDAICIDQTNLKERSWQVQMMGDIYSKSSTTIAWLGPDSVGCSHATNLVKNSFRSWESRPEHLQKSLILPDEIAEYEVFVKNELEHETALQEIEAFEQLLKRSWFRRAWVVQEVTLSKNVILFWGSKSIQISYWEWFDSTITLLRQHYYSLQRLGNTFLKKMSLLKQLISVQQSAEFFCRTTDLRRVIRADIKLNLMAVFDAIRPFEASLAVDKLYAGIGMSPDGKMITVDYSLKEQDVFIRCANSCLQLYNLDILSLCWPSTIEDLPSWVIDLTAQGHDNLGSHLFIDNNSEKLYCAGGEMSPTYIVEDGNVLSLKGTSIGELSFIGDLEAIDRFWGGSPGHTATVEDMVTYTLNPDQKPTELFNHRYLQQVWQGEWLRHRKQMGSADEDPKNYYWTGEDLWKAFERTICADIIKSDSDDMRDRRLDKDFMFTEPNTALLSCTTLGTTLNGRVFAVTSTGHYCLVRQTAKVGDLVIIAAGAETPYLLRPKDEGYFEFFGYCYVHGFMDGEAFTPKQSKTGSKEIALSDFPLI